MFNRKIYDLNVKRLVLQQIPTNLRQPKFVALLTALISPVMYVYALFNNYRLQVRYRFLLTPQVCRMQMYLNDLYDYDLRRIKIIDGPAIDPMVFYLENEITPTELILEGEKVADYAFFLEGEVPPVGIDFIVIMPADLSGLLDENLLKSRINEIKLLTKTYQIVYE